MRWPACCLWMLTLPLAVGCPTAHRRDGTLDRAAGADMEELLEGLVCGKAVYDAHCEGKEQSDECREACGE